jgi:L-seryl-tRNA(Ser) seleniumtransferase
VAESNDPRRQLPAVDALLAHDRIKEFASIVSQDKIAAVIRDILSETRRGIELGKALPSREAIVQKIVDRLLEILTPFPRRVVNATGVILHTGLGRAPLSEKAIRALVNSAGYCQVEFNLDNGDRGDRQHHVELLLKQITATEAALVVNNNAAALYLTLNTLAHRRDVIVSRGQLIEIGGSFRLPDIMQRSGVKLVEVGTTNRTRVEDFANAITSKTALLLNAHTSNYRMVGFTESASIDDLVALGRSKSIPVVDDVGNGLITDWTSLGFPPEPNVDASLKAGADLVLISGDKTLGGPQAGIILGSKSLVNRLKKSPLARVLRPDKLTLAALDATLQAYLHRDEYVTSIPVWKMLTSTKAELLARAQRLYGAISTLGSWSALEIADCDAEAGSGTLPAVALPSVALRTLPRGLSANSWVGKLRAAEIPVVATVRQDVVWLDMRTIADADEDLLIRTVQSILQKG